MADNTQLEDVQEVNKTQQQEGNKQEGKSSNEDNSVMRAMRQKIKEGDAIKKEVDSLRKYKEEVEQKKLEDEGKTQELLEKEREKRLNAESKLKKVKTDNQLRDSLSDISNPQAKKLVQAYAKDLVQTDDEGNITNLTEIKASIESEFNTIIKPQSPMVKGDSGYSDQTPSLTKKPEAEIMAILQSGNAEQIKQLNL